MKTIIIMMVLIVIVFVLLVLILVKAASNHEKNIYENGIETDSVVSRIERHLDSDNRTRYSCYVKYSGNDGIEHEGRLNVSSNLPIGRKVRIKYLPDKYDDVVFVSQELE